MRVSDFRPWTGVTGLTPVTSAEDGEFGSSIAFDSSGRALAVASAGNHRINIFTRASASEKAWTNIKQFSFASAGSSGGYPLAWTGTGIRTLLFAGEPGKSPPASNIS